jgi:hypothetical protein
MVHACNPRTQEAEAGRLYTQGQFGLHNEKLSTQKTGEKRTFYFLSRFYGLAMEFCFTQGQLLSGVTGKSQKASNQDQQLLS